MSATAKPKRRNAHLVLRRRLENIKIIVPETDWARVICGEKRMFRSYSRRTTDPAIMPTPFIAYRFRIDDSIDSKVLVLEETWQEPLGAISPDDLCEEGFESLDEFRRYFAQRYPNGGFRPLAEVQVYRVRPLLEGDLEVFGRRLCEELGYG